MVCNLDGYPITPCLRARMHTLLTKAGLNEIPQRFSHDFKPETSTKVKIILTKVSETSRPNLSFSSSEIRSNTSTVRVRSRYPPSLPIPCVRIVLGRSLFGQAASAKDSVLLDGHRLRAHWSPYHPPTVRRSKRFTLLFRDFRTAKSVILILCHSTRAQRWG